MFLERIIEYHLQFNKYKNTFIHKNNHGCILKPTAFLSLPTTLPTCPTLSKFNAQSEHCALAIRKIIRCQELILLTE